MLAGNPAMDWHPIQGGVKRQPDGLTVARVQTLPFYLYHVLVRLHSLGKLGGELL